MSEPSYSPRRFLIPAVAGVGSALAAAVCWRLVVFIVSAVAESTSSWVLATWSLSALLVPLVIGAVVARYADSRARRHQDDAHGQHSVSLANAHRVTGRRIAVYILAALYAATWAVGAPAVNTELTREVLESASELRSEGRQVYDVPRISVVVSFPILPGVLVTYHDRQIAGMNGWGGWLVHGCGPWGVRELYLMTLRVS